MKLTEIGFIPESWTIARIGDLIESKGISVGVMYPGIHTPGGIPLIKAGDVSNGKIRDITFCISEEINEKYRRTILEGGELLIVLVGTPGISVVVSDFYKGWNAARALAVLKLLNPEQGNFIHYALQSREVQHILYSLCNTTVQTTLNLKELKQIPIPWPTDFERNIIVKILSSIDDKIELNRQMNQTLEAMAQALFKSWFVDFDPVMDNALAMGNDIPDELQAMAEKRSLVPDNQKLLSKNPELAALFPSSFEYNETLGKWIPEGWEVKKFGDVSKCFDNKRIPLSKKEREEKQPGPYPYYGATSINDYINDYIFDDTYLLLGEDGSVMREDGTPFTQYVWGKIWVNNHAHVLQGKNGVSTEHLLTFIRNEDVGGYVTGAVQLKINQGNMNRIPFLYATEDLHREFAKILAGIYSKYKLNHEKTETLTKLRDRLLPELISGKIKVINFNL